MSRNLLILSIVACGPTRWQASPAQLAPLPEMPVKAQTSIGPLAIVPGAGETSWPDRGAATRITDGHYLDAPRIHEETTQLLALVDAFYRPLTPETRIGFDQVHREMATLDRLAPYSISSVTLGFIQASERLHLCFAYAGTTFPCFRDLKPHEPGPVFETREVAPGIAMLSVHDLRDAKDPAWRAFPDALLAKYRGIVVDLRDAVGSDPRALLPWVARFAGKTLHPIRAVERGAGADPFVAAYAAKFSDRGRDPAIWKDLVATASGEAARPPIEVIVGAQCEAACELIARMLETYAGAVVLGGVTYAGRLARDEPALLVMPHSKTQIFFHATRYLLADEIEAATGPTEEWHALLQGDPAVVPKVVGARAAAADLVGFAVREITTRLAHPEGPGRCDAAPVSTTDTAKIQGLSYLASTCEAGYEITIASDAPASALRRYLATCATKLAISMITPGDYYVGGGKPTAAVMSQIAASDLVERVSIQCSPRYHID